MMERRDTTYTEADLAALRDHIFASPAEPEPDDDTVQPRRSRRSLEGNNPSALPSRDERVAEWVAAVFDRPDE